MNGHDIRGDERPGVKGHHPGGRTSPVPGAEGRGGEGRGHHV